MWKGDVSRECSPRKLEITWCIQNKYIDISLCGNKRRRYYLVKRWPRTTMVLTWLVREANQACHCGSLFLSPAKTRAHLWSRPAGWRRSLRSHGDLCLGCPGNVCAVTQELLFWMQWRREALAAGGLIPVPSLISCLILEKSLNYSASVSTTVKLG